MYEYQMFKNNWQEVNERIEYQALEGWRVVCFTPDPVAGGFYVVMERPKRKAEVRGSAAQSSPR